MTLKLVLPVDDFGNSALPKFAIDPILPPNGGALLLVDPTHPVNPWAAGLPSHNTNLPNIASAQLATLLGAAEGTQYPVPFLLGGGINNNTKGKVERTGKGALHGIVSQANSLSAGDGVAFGIPTAIRTYLIANPNHQIYISCWDRLTRITGGSLGSTDNIMYGVMAASVNSHLVGACRSVGPNVITPTSPGTPMVPTNRTAPTNDPIYNSLGERFTAFTTEAGSPSTGTSVNTAFAGPFMGAYTSTYNAAVIASRNGYWPSILFRRFYVEDLTVSGRTYAQVSTLDKALWAQEVTTVGGRYYDDTFTAVTDVP